MFLKMRLIVYINLHIVSGHIVKYITYIVTIVLLQE